jgi:hypothetical protein
MLLDELLALQSGVVSRRQAHECELRDHDIRRRLRRREWARVHDGVYVDHTGPLTWRQRSWGAVLATAPAALCHASALRAAELASGTDGHDDGKPIHVAVDRDRVVTAPAGVVVHRMAGFETLVLDNTAPPRQRYEEAVIDVAARARDEMDAVAVLAAAVGDRRTTAARLLTALDGRRRVPRRAFLAGVLADVSTGTCSVLEHGYLDRVERPHGLPVAERQVRDSSRGTVYRDVDYAGLGLLVELDGRLVHGEATQRDLDLDRDLAAAVAGRTTVRLGWGQVFHRPCATAAHVAVLLTRHGWTGELRPCAQRGTHQPPGDVDPPRCA